MSLSCPLADALATTPARAQSKRNPPKWYIAIYEGDISVQWFTNKQEYDRAVRRVEKAFETIGTWDGEASWTSGEVGK